MIEGSNNTNKLSPQEHNTHIRHNRFRSNNTNKLSPQEHEIIPAKQSIVQIIQINLVLKNTILIIRHNRFRSNNTNKLSPQEHEIIPS